MGYHRAGFSVYGVDIEPQPNYPFPFLQMDALEALARLLRGEGLTFSNGETLYLVDFVGIHSSPPCQHASTIAKQQRALRPGKYNHPNLIPQTREGLQKTGKPYIIENVEGAFLVNPARLCGSYFGLDVRRHRLFETNFPVFSTPCSHNLQTPRFRSLDKRRKALARVVGVHGHINYSGELEIRKRAMGIEWMNNDELVEAIPPAYTQFIGERFMETLK